MNIAIIYAHPDPEMRCAGEAMSRADCGLLVNEIRLAFFKECRRAFLLVAGGKPGMEGAALEQHAFE